MMKDAYMSYTKEKGDWLIDNTYMVNEWSGEVIRFIKKEKWAKDFLVLNLFSEFEIYKQIRDYEIKGQLELFEQ